MKKKHIAVSIILLAGILVYGIWWGDLYPSKGKSPDDGLSQYKSTLKNLFSGSKKNTGNTNPSAEKPAVLDQLSPVPSEFTHLRLIGTASNTEKQPYAVIDNTETKAQGLYKIGDIIEGATIIDIKSDEVILAFKDQKFKLILEKSGSSDKQLSTDKLLHESPNPFVHMTQEDVQKAWEDTQNLMTQIEMEQNLDKDEPNGVKVAKVVPDSIFEKIGFKSGDILIEVDDMKMTVANDAMEVYNCIRTKPAVQFTVLREGEPNPVILHYDRQMWQK